VSLGNIYDECDKEREKQTERMRGREIICIVGGDTCGEVGGWGRDPKKCTGRGWGMGSSTI